MTIDALGLRLNKDALGIRTHDVTLYTIDAGPTGSCGIEEYLRLLARFERIFNDLLTIGRNLGVALTIAKGYDGRDRLAGKLTAGDIFQC